MPNFKTTLKLIKKDVKKSSLKNAKANFLFSSPLEYFTQLGIQLYTDPEFNKFVYSKTGKHIRDLGLEQQAKFLKEFYKQLYS